MTGTRERERERPTTLLPHSPSLIPSAVCVRGQKDTPVLRGVITINYLFYINCSRPENTWWAGMGWWASMPSGVKFELIGGCITL